MSAIKTIRYKMKFAETIRSLDVGAAILELDERLRALEGKDKAESPAKDPLAPWKALKAGDKVLEKSEKEVWHVESVHHDGIYFHKTGNGCVDHCFYYWANIPHSWQILQTGPFSADKCYVGMWVWIEDNRRTKKYEGWVTIISIHKRLGVFTTLPDGSKHLLFRHDGTHENDEPFEEITLHFAPPDQPTISPIEKAVEKIFDASKRFHAPGGRIDMFNNEITAILTELEAGR